MTWAQTAALAIGVVLAAAIAWEVLRLVIEARREAQQNSDDDTNLSDHM